MTLLLTLYRTPRHRLWMLVRTGLELGRAAWLVRRWPFPRIAAALGPAHPVSASTADFGVEELTPANRALACDTSWAVALWVRRWPYPPTCLMQALAARRILDAAQVPSRLYFGVRGTIGAGAAGAGEIGAHAWLCTGDVVVTGAGEAALHRPIALYRSVVGLGRNAVP